MARMSAAHRTQITIALITVAGGITVAVLTSWDKFFPPAPAPAPAAENRQTAQGVTAAPPVTDQALNELSQMRNAQAGLIDRSAGAIDDISRQIDAQSNSLAQQRANR